MHYLLEVSSRDWEAARVDCWILCSSGKEGYDSIFGQRKRNVWGLQLQSFRAVTEHRPEITLAWLTQKLAGGRLPSCLAGLTGTHSLESLTKKKQLPMISIMLNPIFSTSEEGFLTLQTPDHFLEGKTVKSLYLETIPPHTPVKRRVEAAIKRRVDTFICSLFSSLDWEAHERKRSGIKSKELSSLRIHYVVSSASLSQYWLTVAVCLPSRSLPC